MIQVNAGEDPALDCSMYSDWQANLIVSFRHLAATACAYCCIIGLLFTSPPAFEMRPTRVKVLYAIVFPRSDCTWRNLDFSA